MKLHIHTDGGARGNPGPAAVGVVIEAETESSGADGRRNVLSEFGKRIGEASNNVAEYRGVIEALAEVLRLKQNHVLDHCSSILFYLDSTLVVNQLNGVYKMKSPHLRVLMLRIRELEEEAGCPVMYSSVPREQNSRADYFVNQALDAA